MKSKGPVNKVLNLKAILIASSLVILVLLVVIRSKYSPSSSLDSLVTSENSATKDAQMECAQGCNKIPASLAHAIVHYATSNTTQRQTFSEISVSARVLELKSPCNFLVFGLGHDSLMWSALNHGGRTVFLDEDETWIEKMCRQFPMLESYKVTYDTEVRHAKDLMHLGVTSPACRKVRDARHSACQLALKGFPSQVYETQWDLVMVGAPTRFHEDAPGKMTAIYTVGLMARNREDGAETDVFVHDVDRDVEEQFSRAFLCRGYLRRQEGRIRHFTIPSHRRGGNRDNNPFCPST